MSTDLTGPEAPRQPQVSENSSEIPGRSATSVADTATRLGGWRQFSDTGLERGKLKHLVKSDLHWVSDWIYVRLMNGKASSAVGV